jgi:WD40 repeat protein
LWNTSTCTLETEVQTNTDQVLALSFSPDGNHVFWGGKNQELNWADRSGHSPSAWKFPVNDGAVRVLAFQPDGPHLVCGGGDGGLHLCTWDGKKVQQTAELRGHTAAVNDATFAPDGKTLATVGEDWKIILWDAATGTIQKSWELRFAVQGVAFAPDGRHLVTANANSTVFILRLPDAGDAAQARR